MEGKGDDIERRRPETLEPHPENERIYDDRDLDAEGDASFIESVRKKGVLTPVIIDQNDRIISGHRRVEAAKRVGLETVPVTTHRFDSDLERLEQLIELNRQREKTVTQKLREAEAIERIERERAKRRQGTRTDTSCSDEQDVDDGLTRDRVAEKVGFGSGSTYHRAKTVWEANESDDADVAATAKEQLNRMDAGEQSVNGAYSEVMDVRRRRSDSEEDGGEDEDETETESKEPEPDTPARSVARDAGSAPILLQGDAASLPIPDETVDIIVTSPPYNLGHERWAMGWRSMRDEGVGYYDDRPEDEYQEWQQQLLQEWHRVASKGASLFYVHKVRIDGGEIIHPAEWLVDDANPWHLRQEIVWNRKSTHNHEPTLFSPIDARVYWMTKGTPAVPEEGVSMSSVWDIYGPRPDTHHPAPFPEDIPQQCLEAVGTDGDVVLDPMAGSMTTCRAADDLDYRSIGIDANRRYVARARTSE